MVNERDCTLRKLSTHTMIVVVLATSSSDRNGISSKDTNETTCTSDGTSSLLLKMFDINIHLGLSPSSSKSHTLRIEVQNPRHNNNNNKKTTSTDAIKTIQLHQRELLVVPSR